MDRVKRRKWPAYLLALICCLCLLAACSTDNQPRPNGEISVTVKRVVDGDTFETTTGEKVRLIGVDTPETVKPNHPVEPYGKEASQFTKQLLEGKTLTLRFDVEPYDKYHRLLAYAYLPDGTFVNDKLVRDGYARVMTIPPNVAFAEQFLAAEREAREHHRGLWGLQQQDGKTDERISAEKKIKGNINSKGEKIYHLPGSRDYERTKAEVWFATEEEAKAAGFRPPRR
jgi:micrococcal nuclease